MERVHLTFAGPNPLELKDRTVRPGDALLEGTLASGITAADFLLLVRRHIVKLTSAEDEAPASALAKRRKLQGAEV